MNDNVLNRQFLETGSEEALNLLMQKHYKSIRAYVFTLLENHHDADEITSETFCKSLQQEGND